jgi:hypothetical protein
MFDKYLIRDGSLRNLEEDGRTVGFGFEAKLGYYRGLGLTMLEALDITVDGVSVPRDAVRFHYEDGPLTLDEMETAGTRRWEFGEANLVSVRHPGGLAAGDHEIALTEVMRISYLPFPLKAADTKTMRVAVP